MMLTAHAQVAAAPDTLQVWVGMFGVAVPPAPELRVEGGPGQPETLAPLRAIRDHVFDGQKRALNHRAILQVTGLQPDTSYRLEVVAGGQSVRLSARTLPAELPWKLDGAFNILLCSCYSQPEDASGLLGAVVSQIMLRPHMTMMLGDQIYGDLPIFEDLPGSVGGVARVLGEKYRRNWASSQLGTGGLGPVLARAPVVCVADDHEYWNNYPFRQKQLPKTWDSEERKEWEVVARALYEDYQLPGAAGGAQRIDVDPLKILVVDMRSGRDKDFDVLVEKPTLAAITSWADDLVAARAKNRPAFGMLTSGQALFVAPKPDSKRETEDAELSNYKQFERDLLPVFERLSDAGVPLIYVTGDVHWGRLAQARDMRSGRPMMYEVIASPSRLIRIPSLDSLKERAAKVKGLFGSAPPWPRHSTSDGVPKQLGKNGRYWLECDLEQRGGHAKQGDQVAVLSLCRAGAGIDFNVTYYGISTDKALAKSDPTRGFELRNL